MSIGILMIDGGISGMGRPAICVSCGRFQAARGMVTKPSGMLDSQTLSLLVDPTETEADYSCSIAGRPTSRESYAPAPLLLAGAECFISSQLKRYFRASIPVHNILHLEP